MKRLDKTICGSCNAILNVSELEPFTKFSCPGCGTEIYSPAHLGHIRFDKPLKEFPCFQKFEGFDAKGNIYVDISYFKGKQCSSCGVKNIINAALKEAEILRQLSHPNICPLSGDWVINEQFVATSPLMDGFDLSEYNPSSMELLDVEIMLNILQKVAIGIFSAHQKNIIHHNICPANVHIDMRRNVRVKNFFTSRFLYKICPLNDWKGDFSATDFFSPEKILTRQEGKEGDIFSFGVMSYFLLSGKLPFPGVTLEERIFSRCFQSDSKFKYKEPLPLTEVRKDFPSKISKIIMQMLSPRPEERASLPEFISAVNFFNAENEKDRIYETEWKMLFDRTDTKPIPKLDKIGLSGSSIEGKNNSISIPFSIKSFFVK
ncbi:MAG TPA: protein kinase [Victivallales bacterium]|nr:protein kinase [Victivallales bacterium]